MTSDPFGLACCNQPAAWFQPGNRRLSRWRLGREKARQSAWSKSELASVWPAGRQLKPHKQAGRQTLSLLSWVTLHQVGQPGVRQMGPFLATSWLANKSCKSCQQANHTTFNLVQPSQSHRQRSGQTSGLNWGGK